MQEERQVFTFFLLLISELLGFWIYAYIINNEGRYMQMRISDFTEKDVKKQKEMDAKLRDL